MPYILFAYLFFILLFILTRNFPFFWDKDILFSRMAHWLLENHFSIVLPDNLDPGYPPALGYLLAITWQLFGISLPAAHALMLPFTLGIVWQSNRLIRTFLPGEDSGFALLIIIINTTFLSQTVVFSTDLVMLFFMLLGLNAIIANKRVWLMLAITGLLFSHMRGLTVAATLGIFDLYRHGKRTDPVTWLRRLPPYLPALTLFAAWAVFHFNAKGWIGYHPASPWAACYELVDAGGFLRNVFILVWRLGDFGMVFLWIISGILWFLRWKQHKTEKQAIAKTQSIASLLVLLGVSVLLTAPPMLIYKIMSGHRYLIPVYYFLSVLLAVLIYSVPLELRLKKALKIITVLALLSGSFWIYPDKIAKGWDANFAHLPYHHLRKKMIAYMDLNHIPVSETGSEVPNTSPIDYIELNGDLRAFHRADLKHDKFVFYSNLYNMFTDKEIDQLKNHWIVEKEYRWLQIRVTLYKRVTSD
jgi:hypothetical protein